MKVMQGENLIKKYGQGETEVIALREISFQISSGEWVAIMGESGSGKSTLLSILQEDLLGNVSKFIKAERV